MGLLDYFRRPAPIRDAARLGDFIDQHTAFLAQKGLYEYARARAGHYAKVLFGEKEFQTAIDQARWRAYPLCLAMVTELVEGVLSPRLPIGGNCSTPCSRCRSRFSTTTRCRRRSASRRGANSGRNWCAGWS